MSQSNPDSGVISNTGLHAELSSAAAKPLAIAGLVFCALSAVFYGVFFVQVARLPSDPAKLEQLRSNTPVLMRLVVTGGSGGLLNLVALILSAIAWAQSRRQRLPAMTGVGISPLMLLGIFAVIVIGGLAAG